MLQSGVNKAMGHFAESGCAWGLVYMIAFSKGLNLFEKLHFTTVALF